MLRCSAAVGCVSVRRLPARRLNTPTAGQPDARLQAYIVPFLEGQAVDLRAGGLPLSLPETRVALMQIFSAIMVAALSPALVELSGVSLRTADDRQAYLVHLIQKLLK